MIILDSCVIRGMRLNGSEADVLRAIVRTKAERVGAPWMAIEELAAQKALDYQDAHRVAARALRLLQNKSHRTEPDLGDPDPEAVREQWRGRYGDLVQVLPTSEAALREGVFREANTLPPATTKGDGDKKVKVGARDVAIWLTAVEYAREHPDETVYFVSSNHKDFTKGGGDYPHPMNTDLEGLGGRFQHLSNLADVLALVAPRVDVEDTEVRKQLSETHGAIIQELFYKVWGSRNASYPVRTKGGKIEEATRWLVSNAMPKASLVEVSGAEAYRLGDEEYVVVSVRWQIAGLAMVAGQIAVAATYWDTRLLASMGAGISQVQLLSTGSFQPIPNADEVDWPHSHVNQAMVRDFLHKSRNAEKMTWPEILMSMAMALSMSASDRQQMIDSLSISHLPGADAALDDPPAELEMLNPDRADTEADE
ncbi:PIN domain-containing protein [Streptomyces sp. NPDC000341]|uniref:PIN domain-containing protein n=1 Tax=Streptomyces sp. NPDC000341 TaxID=3156645 RepID=UPI0033324241